MEVGYIITPTSLTTYKFCMAEPTRAPASARGWCFTKNNPTSNEIEPHPKESYIVWQLEEGEQKTPHLQGYIELSSQQRLSSLTKWLPGAHFSVRRGTPLQASDYCRKEPRLAGPWSRGELPETNPGKRNDIVDCLEDILQGATRDEVMDKHPGVLARHPRFVDEAMQRHAQSKVRKLLEITPRSWQAAALEIVQGPVDPRAVFWYYDPLGNSGKTFLGRHLVDAHGAFYCNGGKSVDVSYAFCGQPVVIFDYVRDAEQFVNYGTIEQIKNGLLFSSKYQAVQKRFDSPHVFVFANFFPATDKMSRDRWRIFEIKEDGTFLAHTVRGAAGS